MDSRSKLALGFTERRTAQRYPLEADLEYRVLRPGQEGHSYHGHALNMSRKGVLLKTTQRLAVGAAVEMWIEWPARPVASRRRLYVCGWIVRQSGSSVAVTIRQYSFEDEHTATQT